MTTNEDHQPGSAARYRLPWPWLAVAFAAYAETRIPPHIWLDNVVLGLSALLALAVVVHGLLWFGAWLWLTFRKGSV
jgi:hypothetical protein